MAVEHILAEPITGECGLLQRTGGARAQVDRLTCTNIAVKGLAETVAELKNCETCRIDSLDQFAEVAPLTLQMGMEWQIG